MSFSNPKQKVTQSRDNLISWYPMIAFLLHIYAIVISTAALYGYFFADIPPMKLMLLSMSAILTIVLGNQLITHYGIDVLLNRKK